MNIPTHLKRKDRVLIDNEKLNQLFEWRDQNKDLVRSFAPVLSEVVIVVTGVYIHVKESDKPGYTYKITVDHSNSRVLSLYWNRYLFRIHIEEENIDAPAAYLEDYRKSVISVYASIMAYMENYKEVVTEKTVRTRKTKRSTAGKNRKKKTRVTYINRKEYQLPDDIQADTNKRNYTKPAHAFPVRGHWRTVDKKTGRKTWIPGYTKNEDAGPAEPKTYKL